MSISQDQISPADCTSKFLSRVLCATRTQIAKHLHDTYARKGAEGIRDPHKWFQECERRARQAIKFLLKRGELSSANTEAVPPAASWEGTDETVFGVDGLLWSSELSSSSIEPRKLQEITTGLFEGWKAHRGKVEPKVFFLPDRAERFSKESRKRLRSEWGTACLHLTSVLLRFLREEPEVSWHLEEPRFFTSDDQIPSPIATIRRGDRTFLICVPVPNTWLGEKAVVEFVEALLAQLSGHNFELWAPRKPTTPWPDIHSLTQANRKRGGCDG